MKYFEQIILNMIGGAIVVILDRLYLKLTKRYYGYGFKKIFGKDAEDNFFIVYGRMQLLPCFDQNQNPLKWPYFKPGTDKVFNISSPISFTETKSAKYLSEAFGKAINTAPKLMSDYEIQEKLDISFCSLGGFNNFKTIDVLECEENNFFEMDLSESGGIISKKDKEKIFSIDGTYDYGLIVKIIPKSFPNRVWIAVAGLGEWGTSGAAWFLSRNWGKIKKMVDSKPFGLIIRVRAGKDESAEIVHSIACH